MRMQFLEKICNRFLPGKTEIFLFFLVLWFTTVWLSGMFSSGFHFEDDYIIQMNEDVNINKLTLLSTYKKWQLNDLSSRFRPISYIPLILEMKFFGLNFPLWYVYQCLLGVLTCYFFFIGLQLLNFSKGECLLFTFFSMGGIQTTAYWHLGYSEPLGLLFLSLGILYMIKATIEKQRKTLNKGLFVVFVILGSLSKESYVLIIPAIIFWMLWCQSKYTNLSFFQSISRNWILVLILSGTLLAELFIILKYIGTNKTGYAGLDTGFFNPAKIQSLFTTYWVKNYLCLIPVFIFFSVIAVKDYRTRLKKHVIYHLPIFLLSLFIVLPQFVLYFKSGINERYLFPAILGAAFLNIYLIHYFQRANQFNIVHKYVLNSIIVFIVLANVYRLYTRAYLYAEEGRETQKFLSAIIENSNPASKIVIAGHPVIGWAGSLALYMHSSTVQRTNIFLMNMDSLTNYTPVEKDIIKNDLERCFHNKTFDAQRDSGKTDVLVLYESLEKQFLKKNTWFRPEKFKRMEFGRSIFRGKEAYGKMIFYFKTSRPI